MGLIIFINMDEFGSIGYYAKIRMHNPWTSMKTGVFIVLEFLVFFKFQSPNVFKKR